MLEVPLGGFTEGTGFARLVKSVGLDASQRGLIGRQSYRSLASAALTFATQFAEKKRVSPPLGPARDQTRGIVRHTLCPSLADLQTPRNSALRVSLAHPGSPSTSSFKGPGIAPPVRHLPIMVSLVPCCWTGRSTMDTAGEYGVGYGEWILHV